MNGVVELLLLMVLSNVGYASRVCFAISWPTMTPLGRTKCRQDAKMDGMLLPPPPPPLLSLLDMVQVVSSALRGGLRGNYEQL